MEEQETIDIETPEAALPQEVENRADADAKATAAANDDKPLASVREVFSFGAGRKKRVCMVLGILCAICSGAVFPAVAFFFSRSFQALGASTSNEDFLQQVRRLAFTFIILGGLSFVFAMGNSTFFETAADLLTLDLKKQWFHALLRQDHTYFDITDISATATIISTNGLKYKKGLGQKFAGCIQFAVTFFGGLAYAFWASWQVSLMLLTTIPFIASSAWFLITMNQSQSSRANAGYADAGSTVQTTVSSIRTILSLNAVQLFIDKFVAATEKAYKEAVKVLHLIGLANGTMYASVQLGYIILLLFGSYLLYDNILATGCDPSGTVPNGVGPCNPDASDVLGALIGVMFAAITMPQISIGVEAFTDARAACYPAIQAINRKVGNDKESAPPPVQVRRASAYLPKYVIDSSSEDGLKPSTLNGAIEIQNVTFAYPTRQESNVLEGFSLTIKPGSTVALVGPSGCGKSTVVTLLERFYDPTSGSVTLDGHDLRDLNVHWLRQQIGLVSQEPALFACSIRENIAYGMPGASQEQIEEAAKMANAHDFITEFPEGYATPVSGTALSGGQKQRIAIARALIKNPQILMLDEATSALDSSSERLVQDALDSVVAERKHTTIVVAHRLSTIRNADTIFVLNHGKIVEAGTHAELIERQGLYHNLVEAQNANPADRRRSSVTGRRRSSLTSANDIDELQEGYEHEIPTLQFKDVYFHYPSRPDLEIFRGLNFCVYEGETLALVGPSGHGKSTTISLIERFYDPTSGAIEFDGVNLKDINIQWLRGQLGLVGQEPVLFDTTIAENIRLGSPGATQEQIESAAKQANAHDFIMSFPDGYATSVGAAGDQVSGGQKQRIAIARALIGNPRIMLLDEATSNLDSESENVVQEALEKIMKSTPQTTIVIAHRLSTITYADRIAVISDGRVCEIGTHDELMAKPDGHYRRLQAFQDLQGNRFDDLSVRPKLVGKKRQESSHTSKANEKKDGQSEEEEEIDKATAKLNAHRARLLAKEDWKLFVIGGVGALLAGIAFPGWGVLLAFVIETLFTQVDCAVDDVDCQENIANEMRESSFMVAVGCAVVIVTVVIGYVLLFYGFGTASERMNKRVRDAAFKALVRQEIGWFDLRPVGQITSELQDDAAMIHSFSGEPIRTVIMTFASLLVGVIISFVFMWPFTLLTLATVPFMAFGAEVKMKRMRGTEEDIEDGTDSPGAIVVESLMNIRTVASLTIEETKGIEYAAALHKMDPNPLWSNFLAGMALGLADLFRMLGMALMFFVGGWLLVSYPTTYTFRDFLISMFSLLYSISGIGMAAQGATDREAAKQAAHRIFDELIDRQSAIDPLSEEGKKNI